MNVASRVNLKTGAVGYRVICLCGASAEEFFSLSDNEKRPGAPYLARKAAEAVGFVDNECVECQVTEG